MPNPVITPHRIEVAKAAGLQNVEAIVEAAQRAQVDIAPAFTLIQGESNGANIYGHDAGGTFWLPSGQTKPVTLRNWHDFYVTVVAKQGRSNGVGPAQITYRGYFNAMLDLGLEPWTPVDNITYGLQILQANFEKTHSWAKAATLYNVGNLNAGVNDYGYSFSKRLAAFKKAFAA